MNTKVNSYEIPCRDVNGMARRACFLFYLSMNDKCITLCLDCALVIGCSGGPMIMPRALNDISNPGGLEAGNPASDLVVGVVFCSNYSSLVGSGIGCVMVSRAWGWIDGVINQVLPI